MIKKYYELAKPGIVYGNAITTIGGFFLAAKGHFILGLFLATLIGSSLVVGSGCVFNNYLDRDIDTKMARTKRRALVEGTIRIQNALAYGAILGGLGVGILAYFTNTLTVIIGLVGFLLYVVVYGYFKRRSLYGTHIGSLAGAIPPLAGYTAVSNHLDVGAILLFLIVVVWQMPHFFSITLYRMKEYEAAGIPVLPLKKGSLVTRIQTLLYIGALFVLAAALSLFGYAGIIYSVVMLVLVGYWFWIGIKGFVKESDPVWGRKMFRFSLIIISLFSLLISFTHVLP